ncbi:MAG: TolB-like protein [Ascidiaceihabitans sp.]
MPIDLKLHLRLHGAFEAYWSDETALDIPGTKLKALLAVLGTAPRQRADRVWLQDMLWGRSGPEAGRASLRQALSRLRRVLGDHFDTILKVEQQTIGLRSGSVVILDAQPDDVFLSGIDVAEEAFEDWLRQQRSRPIPAQAHEQISDNSYLLPTVATLPFQMYTLASDGGPLGDMLAQEVSRALSRSQFLCVISHLSSRRIDAQRVVMKDIHDKIGADYVICGSLRLRDDKMAVVVDLVEVATGRVLWTRDFEGALDAFLAGESELVWQIATHTGRGIVMSSLDLAAAMPMPNIKSHTLLMSGIGLIHRQNPTGFALAREQIKEVLSRAPNHSLVHAWLAKWHVLNVQQGWSRDPAVDSKAAADSCRRALDLNPSCAFSLSVDGFVKNNLFRQFDEAAERFDDAISLDPNNAFAWLLKGTLYAFEGFGKEAVKCTTRARRLSPLDPYGYFFDSLSATACASADDFEGALTLANRSLVANPRHTSTLRVRTVSLEMLGRGEEARQSAQELLRIDPDFTIGQYLNQHPAAMFKTGRVWANALAAAGVPQN